MTLGPQVAVLVSSFERPAHLRKCLLSIALQHDVQDKVEVVVTDDGSRDDTLGIVAEFAATVPFSVKVTTHPHASFQLARCRNEGVLASQAPYLLFLDGDCILPANHISTHLSCRRPSTVMGGDCCRLAKDVSERIDDAFIRQGDFSKVGPAGERRRLRRQHRKAWLYNFIRHPTKPKLVGNNIGIWRSDYELVNGYDEQFVGWGCEDDDLCFRLRRANIRVASILQQTFTYHLWHPVAPSYPNAWREGQNVDYSRNAARRPAFCRQGLSKPRDHLSARQAIPTSPFVEVMFNSHPDGFSGAADLNVLVSDEHSEPLRAGDSPTVVVSPHELSRLLNSLGDATAVASARIINSPPIAA